MEELHLRGLRIMAKNGYSKEELQFEQELELDLTLYCSLQTAMQTDDPADTIDLAGLIAHITHTLRATPRRLLSAAANDVACAVFAFSPQIGGLSLTLQKAQIGALADFDSVAVSFTRARSD